MRSLKLFFVTGLFALSMAACGGDDDDGGSADSAGPVIDGAATIDGAGGAPPVISLVEWTADPACAAGDASDFAIVVTVTDADTAAADLVVTGSVASCTGAIDDVEATVNCPNLAPYAGSVTVTDPEGNSDTQAITIEVCADGSAP